MQEAAKNFNSTMTCFATKRVSKPPPECLARA